MPPHAHVRIHIQPTPALLDTKLTVRVTGLPSAGAVTVRGGSVDGSGRAWRSEAHVVADTAGVVDLARDPAGPGSTYAGVDPMGLIWSMTRAPERDTTAVRDPLDAVPLDVEALVDGHPVAAARVERLALPPDVERTDVRCGAFPGVLFTCAEAGPRPGVVVLGGAEGGVHEADAALLAGHGYATLALAYFDPMAGRWLDRVPVEEFGAALDLLAAHPSVRGDRLGVIGGSFGGATALLVGSHFPAVRAVVSVVGSGVLTQGIEAAPGFLQIMAADTAPYTWRGEPLPFVPNTVTEDVRRLVEAGQPTELGATFLPGLARPRPGRRGHHRGRTYPGSGPAHLRRSRRRLAQRTALSGGDAPPHRPSPPLRAPPPTRARGWARGGGAAVHADDGAAVRGAGGALPRPRHTRGQRPWPGAGLD